LIIAPNTNTPGITSHLHCLSHLSHVILKQSKQCMMGNKCRFLHIRSSNSYTQAEKDSMLSTVLTIKSPSYRSSLETSIKALP